MLCGARRAIHCCQTRSDTSRPLTLPELDLRWPRRLPTILRSNFDNFAVRATPRGAARRDLRPRSIDAPRGPRPDSRRSAWIPGRPSRRSSSASRGPAGRRRGAGRLQQLRAQQQHRARRWRQRRQRRRAAPPTGSCPASRSRRSARTRSSASTRRTRPARSTTPSSRTTRTRRRSRRRSVRARRPTIIWGWGGGGLRATSQANKVEDLTVWFDQNPHVEGPALPVVVRCRDRQRQDLRDAVRDGAADHPVLQQEGLRRRRRRAPEVVGRTS